MDFDRRLWRLDKRLWCLPFEIQLQVINLLDVETKLTCLRVSKSWHAHLLDSAFWSNLISTERFRSNIRPASKTSYMKAIDYAQDGLRNLDVAFPDLLTNRILKYLELRSTHSGSQLRSLSLMNCTNHERFDCRLERRHLDFCANTLEYLRLENWKVVYLPIELPALKTLSITSCGMGDAAHCPRLMTLYTSDILLWNMIGPSATKPLIPNARRASLSFKYCLGVDSPGSPAFVARHISNQPVFSELERMLMLGCQDLEALELDVLDRTVQPAWSFPDYQRNSMQLETIVRVLEEYGRNLKSLTLRNLNQTDETLVAAFRLCPQLDGIHMYQSPRGLHPHFDNADRFGSHQWTVLNSNDLLYSYHLPLGTS